MKLASFPIGNTFVRTFLLQVAIVACCATFAFAGEEEAYKPALFGTAWSLLPPVIAIILAFVTKEANSSLFIGTLAGAAIYADFNFFGTVDHLVTIVAGELGTNGGIIIFVVSLGIIMSMMQMSGCTKAYTEWAAQRVKSKKSALISTTLLGLVLCVDDYFNCLATGNVMRPVTDQHRVSRARLAYNIDCTSAPICIIAPVSSWAAAVASYVPSEYGIDGFALFLRTIPFNFYAILTLTMLVALAVLRFDFGPMRKYERMAEVEGDIYGGTGDLYSDEPAEAEGQRGKVIDMFLPVLVLIVSCVTGLMYTGGFFEGASVIESFSNCDAFLGLPIGGLLALFFTIIWYLGRRIIKGTEFAECIPNGLRLMVPAMIILTFSWSLSVVCRASLGSTEFVEAAMANPHFNLNLLPVILYLIGTFVSFSTGTSWGTFGILIPITLAIFGGAITPLSLVCLSATLAGAVTGDHCSPISETAIMSSTAARVDFMQHVMTQLPYAGFVAGFSTLGYVLAGFMQHVVVLPIIIALMVGTLIGIKKFTLGKTPNVT